MSKRKWYVERDISPSGVRAGDDWIVRYVRSDGRRGSSCWFGSRAEAIRELRRWMNTLALVGAKKK